MSPGLSGASSFAGGCSTSPCTPTVLQCTTRRTPFVAAASTSVRTAAGVDRAVGLVAASPPRDRAPRCCRRPRRPAVARSSDAASARSPSTSVTPLSRERAAPGASSRTSARTSSPRPTRARARCPPVKPVAPVTRTRNAPPRASPASRRGARSPSRASAPSIRSVAATEPRRLCSAIGRTNWRWRSTTPEPGALEHVRDRAIAEHAVRLDARPDGVGRVARHRLNRGGAGERGIVEHHALARDAAELGERLAPARRVHQHAQAHDRVERPVAIRQPMRVAAIERHRRVRIGGAAARHREHLLRRVHAGDGRALEGEGDRRPPGAGADVEDASGRRSARETR